MSQLDDATKQALRLAAVGALLHNLGKINAKFLDKQINSGSNDYLYQHILALIAPHIDKLPTEWQSNYAIDKLTVSAVLDGNTVTALNTCLNFPVYFGDRTDYAVGDFIEYLGQGEPWYQQDNGKFGIEHIFPNGSRLTHLMNRAHRGASGGEKENIATAQQPDAFDLYLSTPFGHETAAPNISNINTVLGQIETTIQRHLASTVDPFPLAKIIAEIRPLLSQALADTQRPLNDVTVGDIGHIGMAFLLTQAAEWILTGRTIDHAELARKEADNTLFWRVLTVHADNLRHLEEAASLVDLRTRQRQLQETFQKVSQKLEETLLAVEIYADEQRRLFVVPDLEHRSAYQALSDILTTFNVDGLHLTSRLSDPVTNHPQDKGGSYIGNVVLQQVQDTPPYDFDAKIVTKLWSGHADGKITQICTACNLRPQGYGAEQVEVYKHNAGYYRGKAEGRSICCICMKRRAGVAEKWAKDELDTTVWLDEVTDTKGRLALIVGQWNLADYSQSLVYPHSNNSKSKSIWLHTVRFTNSSCPDKQSVTLNGDEYIWHNDQSTLLGERKLARLKQTNLSIHSPSSMSITVQDVVVAGEQLSLILQENLTHTFTIGSQVSCWGQNFKITDTHSLETVDDAGRQKILSEVVWNATHPFIVEEATKVNVLEMTSPGQGANSESFARLRRIWQTTQTFWETVFDEPKHDGKLPTIPYRLQISGSLVPKDPEKSTPGDYHVYDLKLTNNIKLSVVWDSQRNLFITADNLEYLAKPELLGKPVIEFLKGELTLEEPSGYGSKNKVWGKIVVEHVGEMENSAYTPAIPILAEPRTFMALVPADRALDITQAIRTKYEREMGKVRNRLPLHLGLVYFQRRTPLRTALDAGRRMLKYESGTMVDEVWTVEEDAHRGVLPTEQEQLAQGTQQFVQTMAVKLQQGDRCLTWYVPAVMGDGQTDDNWYPYVFIENDVSGRQRTFKALRPTGDENSADCWLVHAAELKAGDQIHFTPATLDFQWLDSAGRRFTIAYDENGRRRDHGSRPYLLDDLTTLQEAWEIISGQNGLTSNQIYALRNLVETKREEWRPIPDPRQSDGMFRRFCRDAVVNANWRNTPTAKIEQLTDWAVSGLLTDVIQLHMGIMKEKPQRKDNSNE